MHPHHLRVPSVSLTLYDSTLDLTQGVHHCLTTAVWVCTPGFEVKSQGLTSWVGLDQVEAVVLHPPSGDTASARSWV